MGSIKVNSEFIDEIKSFDSGGGCIIDYVVLIGGQVIGISDDAVVLYSSEEELLSNDEKMDWDSSTIIR